MQAEQLCDDISHFIGESRALLEQDSMVELTGMEARIQDLCARAVELTGAERARIADKLERLLAELTELGQALTQARDQVAGELQNTAQVRKASVAYATSKGGDGKTEDK